MDFLPIKKFRRCGDRYNGNYRVRSFTCFDQFLCMAFAQLAYRESLRDIECCLRAMKEKLYHIGIRGKIARRRVAARSLLCFWAVSEVGMSMTELSRRLEASLSGVSQSVIRGEKIAEVNALSF